MKKKLIPLALFALLPLVGCSNNNIVESGTSSPVAESSESVASESEASSEATSETTPDSSESAASSESSESSESSSVSEESSSSINNDNYELVYSWRFDVIETKGYNYAQNPDAFSAYLPSGVYLSSIYSIYSQGPNTGEFINLTVGSGNNDGEIILTTDQEISRVVLNVSNYYVFYDNNGLTYNVDDGMIGVNGDFKDPDAMDETNTYPVPEDIVFDLAAPTDEITIANQAVTEGTRHRIYLFSVELYA